MVGKLKTFLKTRNFRIFLIFLGICFVAYVGYLNETFISDNIGGRFALYDQQSFGEFFNSGIVVENGRHMSITYWLLHAPLSKIGIDYFHHQWVFFAIEIIVMAIALTIFYKVFERALKCKKTSLPLVLATAFIGVNPFICDSLVFLLPSHPQALLFVALSLLFLTKEFRRKNILLSLLFLTLAVSTYQSYYALFAILALPLVFIENKSKVDKTLFKRVATALGIMAASIAIVLIVSKLHCAIVGIGASKGVDFHLSISWIFSRLLFLIKGYLKNTATSFYLFPPALILAVLAATIIALSVVLVRKRKFKELAYILIVAIFGFFSPIYYGIVANPFYFAPRIAPALFACISIGMVLLMYYMPKLMKNEAFIGGLFVLAAITVYCCSTFITDVMLCNRIEMAEARLLVDQIERYEAVTGTKVSTIAVYHVPEGKFVMQDLTTHNPAAKNSSRELTSTDWSDVNSIRTITGREFKKRVLTDVEYEAVFGELTLDDFKVFNPTVRLKIYGDTAYWASY